MTDGMKQVAWNGIRFKAPRPWQIGRIGTRHLVLEDAGGPVMEVKWGPVKGKFSHAAHLKRLAASGPGKTEAISRNGFCRRRGKRRWRSLKPEDFFGKPTDRAVAAPFYFVRTAAMPPDTVCGGKFARMLGTSYIPSKIRSRFFKPDESKMLNFASVSTAAQHIEA